MLLGSLSDLHLAVWVSMDGTSIAVARTVHVATSSLVCVSLPVLCGALLCLMADRGCLRAFC